MDLEDLPNTAKVGLLAAVIVIFAIGAYFIISLFFADSTISSFEECIAAGNPAMESYPRQCRTESGQHFVEIINEPEQIVCLQGFEPVDGVCPDKPVIEPAP